MEKINLRKLVDKYVPDKWEKEIVIPKSFMYQLIIKKIV